MVLRYSELTRLLQSEVARDAMAVFEARAEAFGFGSIVQRAFAELEPESTYCTHAAKPPDQGQVRDAFEAYERLVWRQNASQHADFAAYVNVVAELAHRVRQVVGYQSSLLVFRGFDGKAVITSPFVRAHIDRVAGLVRSMGAQYLYHPCCYEELINVAYGDLRELGRLTLIGMPCSLETQRSSLWRVLKEAHPMTLASRAGADHETRRELERLGFEMNAAFAGERYADLLQLALETAIRASGCQAVYDDYAASLQGAHESGAETLGRGGQTIGMFTTIASPLRVQGPLSLQPCSAMTVGGMTATASIPLSTSIVTGGLTLTGVMRPCTSLLR